MGLEQSPVCVIEHVEGGAGARVDLDEEGLIARQDEVEGDETDETERSRTLARLPCASRYRRRVAAVQGRRRRRSDTGAGRCRPSTGG